MRTGGFYLQVFYKEFMIFLAMYHPPVNVLYLDYFGAGIAQSV
jgi:hypothetical protein